MPFDGSKLDDVTRLLIEGRKRIEQGWCQNFLRFNGTVCVVGALAAGNGGAAYIRFGHAIGAEINIGQPNDLRPIVDWNDTPGRTKEEVLAAFDRAIAAGA